MPVDQYEGNGSDDDVNENEIKDEDGNVLEDLNTGEKYKNEENNNEENIE